jgi:hypothetical protein
MSWERRTNSRTKFYYRTRRREGRVHKQYVGPEGDPVVRLISQGDTLNQAEARTAVSEVRSEQAAFRELEPLLHAVVRGVREAQELNLLACGYRRRKGRLRAVKFRESKNHSTGINSKTAPDTEPVTRELLDNLARRANRGDREAADRLRTLLRERPEIMREAGDLSRHAEQSLIKLITDGNLVLSESVKFQAEQLRQSLRSEAGDETLERLLIDHVVLCWLELHYVRTAAAQPQQHRCDSRFWEQRFERASARFTSATKELATLRELIGRPPVTRVPEADSK